MPVRPATADGLNDIMRTCGAARSAMQHALAKMGFGRCGRIYREDGTPRIAFHRHRDG